MKLTKVQLIIEELSCNEIVKSGETLINKDVPQAALLLFPLNSLKELFILPKFKVLKHLKKLQYFII